MRRASTKKKNGGRPQAVDLFCGAGGMSLGFEQAGFDVVAGFDSEQRHVETFRHNFPEAAGVVADLTEVAGSDIRALAGIGDGMVAAVFGGPPCQGFSLIGKRDHSDPRNDLVFHFARLVCELQPQYFAMENVGGIRTLRNGSFLDRFVDAVRQAGYEVVAPPRVLNAADFGVPQRRRRLFVIGYHRDLTAPEYPVPADGRSAGRKGFDATQLRPNVGDAIGDLPDVDEFEELLAQDSVRARLGKPSRYVRYLRGQLKDAAECGLPRQWDRRLLTASLRTVHRPESVKRFRKTKPGEYEARSRLYRLSWDGLCPTLRAGTGPENGSFMAARPIHPERDRCISVREAARLHSFPDWFTFDPTKWHGFRQIGNSVPPLLARAVARQIVQTLCQLL